MALERLQARAPSVAHAWLESDTFWPFVLEQLSHYTLLWAE
jgi:hypothetical protein